VKVPFGVAKVDEHQLLDFSAEKSAIYLSMDLIPTDSKFVKAVTTDSL
jgi:hypothetical protein